MSFYARVLSVCVVMGLRAFTEEIIEVPRSGTSATSTEDAEVFYFAYGTNMLEKRLRIKCPEAKFFGPALLKDHRLDFTIEAPWWNGAVATICTDRGSDVWGVVWVVRVFDMDKLDEQEGVSAGWYHPKEVTVLFEGDKKLKAITYVQNHSPRKLNPLDNYPPERQPSLTYHKVMILGAIQGGLPYEYVQYLYTIPNNGKVASQDLINHFMQSSESTKLLL